MTKQTKKFGGKTFHSSSVHKKKSAATKKAKQKRKQGWQVRVSKEKAVKAKKGGHRVFVRKPKSFGK